MSNRTLIRLTFACCFIMLLVVNSDPVSIADEYIPAEIAASPCLTWRQHQEKYPSIKNEVLLSSMLAACPR